jgi:hypothetical protein
VLVASLAWSPTGINRALARPGTPIAVCLGGGPRVDKNEWIPGDGTLWDSEYGVRHLLRRTTEVFLLSNRPDELSGISAGDGLALSLV